MKIVDAISEILKREGVQFLSAYPTTSLIDATAAAGIRSVLCRQERVGVGIADGFTRTSNGRVPGVFAMQYGPGAENAFAGVATAYSDSTPILLQERPPGPGDGGDSRRRGRGRRERPDRHRVPAGDHHALGG